MKDAHFVCGSVTDTLTEAILSKDWWSLSNVILNA